MHEGGKSFTNQVLQDVTNVFRFFDTDQDGLLSLDEAINVWKKFGLVVDVNTIPKEAPIPLDLIIERLEAVHMNSDLEAHLHQAFTILDKSNKGYLAPDDFMSYFADCGETPEKKFILELCELMQGCREDNPIAPGQAPPETPPTETPAISIPQEPQEETSDPYDRKNLKSNFQDFFEWMKREQRRRNKKSRTRN